MTDKPDRIESMLHLPRDSGPAADCAGVYNLTTGVCDPTPRRWIHAKDDEAKARAVQEHDEATGANAPYPMQWFVPLKVLEYAPTPETLTINLDRCEYHTTNWGDELFAIVRCKTDRLPAVAKED